MAIPVGFPDSYSTLSHISQNQVPTMQQHLTTYSTTSSSAASDMEGVSSVTVGNPIGPNPASVSVINASLSMGNMAASGIKTNTVTVSGNGETSSTDPMISVLPVSMTTLPFSVSAHNSVSMATANISSGMSYSQTSTIPAYKQTLPSITLPAVKTALATNSHTVKVMDDGSSAEMLIPVTLHSVTHQPDALPAHLASRMEHTNTPAGGTAIMVETEDDKSSITAITPANGKWT